jgi:hypothetical protein
MPPVASDETRSTLLATSGLAVRDRQATINTIRRSRRFA